MNSNPNTKIYGTLGPACADQTTLEAMLRAGMTGIRLNMSHGDLADSASLLNAFHAAARAVGTEPELLIDLQGPELRIGEAEALQLEVGSVFRLGEGGLPVPPALLAVLAAGDEVLLDDGKLALEVLSAAADAADTRVTRGGRLTSRKSIKVTGKDVLLPVSTDHDLLNLRAAVKYGVTAVMQPFVRSGEDLQTLRRTMEAEGAGHLKIFAKLENLASVAHLEDILPHADVVVIARGDLGNDMPLWQLPAVQKRISAACRKAGKPFIVVTQMLASMERSPVPTRAEVNDVFNAVADGAYGVMVTNETAVGAYPAEAITYLTRTAAEAESWLREQ